MKRFLSITLAVAAVLCLFVGGAAAADGNETTNASSEIVAEQAEQGDYLASVDSDTRVTGWEYDGETFTLEFEADERTTVTLTEAVQFDEGVGQGSMREHTIPAGESSVSINVEPVGGEAALTITTAQSTDEGQFTYVSTGQAGGNWFDGGATWGYVYLASAGTFVGVAFGARHYKRKQQTKADDVEIRRAD